MSKAEAVAALAVERRFPARVLLGEAGVSGAINATRLI
jgi:hypothetical protein